MVIGETFAWGHLPKTAGDATLRMWQLFPELILKADDEHSNAKHDTFVQRLDRVADRLLVLNIRRLPSWNLSHAMHEAQGGIFPDYQLRPMPLKDEIAERTFADMMLDLFTDGGRLTIAHWLRQEMLELDFKALVGRLTDVSTARSRAVENVGMVNVHRYDHRLDRWFTPAQITRMYERNPVWASIERRAYGYTLDRVTARQLGGQTQHTDTRSAS